MSTKDFLNEYINHPNFKKLKKEYILNYGEKCCICERTDNLELHHKTYNMHPGTETLDDVVLICARCHTLSHITINKIREYKEQFNSIVINLICNTLYDCIDKERVLKDTEYKKYVVDGFVDAHTDRIDFLITESGLNSTQAATSCAYSNLKTKLEKEFGETNKKQILDLYYNKKKKPAEIARVVGVSKSTVRRRINDYYLKNRDFSKTDGF